jgi:hypothetical protein
MSHSTIYNKYFNISPHNVRVCELTGSTKNLEIHHIDARGMGGRPSADTIENLMCLTREAHNFFGDKVQYKDWLKEVHLRFMVEKIPFHSYGDHNFYDEFLEEYSPGTVKKIMIYPGESREAMKGYLFGHLAPLAFQLFRDHWGWGEITSKDHAIHKLKFLCGYTYFEDEEEKPLSVGKGPHNKLVYFIQQVFIFLHENDMNPEPPKKR